MLSLEQNGINAIQDSLETSRPVCLRRSITRRAQYRPFARAMTYERYLPKTFLIVKMNQVIG